MSGEKKIIVVQVEPSLLTLSLSLLVLVVLAAVVLYHDYATNYVWVLPLDQGRSVYTYFKPSVLVGIYSAVNSHQSFVVFSGITGTIRVSSSGDYAVISASGVSVYVLAIVVIALTLYAITAMRFRRVVRVVNLREALLLFTILALFAIPILSLYIYVNSGHEYAFSITEEPVRVIYFKDLNYAVVNVTGVPQYVYIIGDEVSEGLNLVAFRVEPRDPVTPIVVLNVATSANGFLEFTYSRSLYLTRGSLNITVVSSAPLENTTLVYYKASFRELSSELPLYVTIAPTLMLALSAVLGVVIMRVMEKKFKK